MEGGAGIVKVTKRFLVRKQKTDFSFVAEKAISTEGFQ